ncbi:MAG TPA: hydrolase [Candidatus Omnitrophota bacterium]|nr:hydrolase [Candidatus Omnitrophota bacterium]
MFLQENAVLLIIDVQGKLAHRMHQKKELFRHIGGLIRVAHFLAIPIIITEQAPEKIGTTVPDISDLLKDQQPIAKTSFSCCGQREFMERLGALNRRQVIVAGIEAHVCVYQTVHDLLGNRYDVQVVGDAISSRTEANKNFAIERVRALGADVTSTEMIVCELLRSSEHPKFREIINLIK